MALRMCRYPGCNGITGPGNQGYCSKHAKMRKEPERKKMDHHKLYDLRAWRKERRVFLSLNPLCAECQRKGKITPARHVDHIEPHGGNEALFWDARNNWQSLCPSCHTVKSNEERSNK
jgi:5-methylcytosine-specific restriction protein A